MFDAGKSAGPNCRKVIAAPKTAMSGEQMFDAGKSAGPNSQSDCCAENTAGPAVGEA